MLNAKWNTIKCILNATRQQVAVAIICPCHGLFHPFMHAMECKMPS